VKVDPDRPLLRDLPRHFAPNKPTRSSNRAAELDIPESLTLRDALAAALLHHPGLRATAWGPRVEEARRLQAGLLPNPEADLELEDFGGSGDLGGTDALETTLSLRQLIELGDKREARVRAAEEAWRVSNLDYEAQRLDVLTETASRFVRVLALQQRAAFAERARELADESRRVIDRRVDAGDVSPIDGIKATLESESARIAADRVERELVAARRELSAMWDRDTPTFSMVLGSLDRLDAVPPLADLADQVDAHPRMRRWAAEADRLVAEAELAKARGVADVTAGLGVRFVAESDDTALVAGLSVPLTIFDRNQGNALAARFRAAQARDENRAIRRDLATRLGREYARLDAAYHEATAIQTTLLPAAREAYEATRRSYEGGKSPYLEVLDAQRTLFATEAQRLEALAEYHAALVQVEGLVSRPLHEAAPASPHFSGD
jgi:cobalt-zinc-cadmium efflux system outer membrane protein